jgi:hypothetical protein
MQVWLATGERRVTIPFAPMLAGLIPPVAVRLRRDFKLLLTLIRAHALLHRATRDRDDQGRIIAAVADYAAVRVLVEKLFSDGIEATVPATVRETVAAVGACVGDGCVGEVPLTALAKKMGLKELGSPSGSEGYRTRVSRKSRGKTRHARQNRYRRPASGRGRDPTRT